MARKTKTLITFTCTMTALDTTNKCTWRPTEGNCQLARLCQEDIVWIKVILTYVWHDKRFWLQRLMQLS